MIEDTFVDNSEKSERLCSICNTQKPLSEFYKDGKDKDGNIKYRRDCKLCYRATRLKTKKVIQTKIQKGGKTIGKVTSNKKRF